MQVTELSAQGLKREYKITVPADEIASRMTTRLERLQRTIRMPGFRPGKAPMPLLRKQYGRSVMGEVLEEAVEQGARQAVEDNQLRPALRPKVDVTSFDEGRDLEFQVNLEILPEVPPVELEAIELKRLVADVDDSRIDQGLESLARSRQSYAAPAEPRPARDGDQLVIDFDGRVDGQPFEGGTGKDFTLALGSRSMVPGFEDQLVGAMPGETREIAVTFPDDFGHAALAGKAANFTVTVKEVREAQPYALDEEWAKGLGEESVEAVRAKLRERLEQEYAGVSRSRLKRQLLDVLAERYVFPVPEGMVDLEFESIWRQLNDEMERTGQTFPEVAGKDEDALKAEYRQIAERRVRLGLLLADIGSRNEVRVESEELQQAAFREAMRFPGQERKVLELFRSNPNALEQLRAPIFEDKVCDLIIAKARVEEERVPIAELLRDPDEEEAAPTGSEETPALAAASDEPASAEPAGADVSSR